MRATLFAALFAVFAAPAASLAADYTGVAKAVDADVIEIGGKRIMLFGMESVERKQNCTIDGKPWECWPAAVRQLETLVSQGETTCRPMRPPDRYGRELALCEINGKSLNEAMVASGFAVARTDETNDFVAAEQRAREQKLGLWQGKFLKPWDFRLAAGILVDRP
ncbi:thermonuclease family protein [Alsobacter sp. SYSU M60028]|uniref:Thermonuclease family protein n=1 Tax=Alsobacter ponti TaxID=2962936 RepID=A0ABT1LDM7_9HYPH|nr:thermonuclease family protein [Alsobacter ponti]MCP8939616.1 thermonuclease family protein [Alsobacter ponti]